MNYVFVFRRHLQNLVNLWVHWRSHPAPATKRHQKLCHTTVLQNAPLVLTCEGFLPTPLVDCMAPRHTGEKRNDIGPIWVQPEHRKVLQGCEHTMYQKNASNDGAMCFSWQHVYLYHGVDLKFTLQKMAKATPDGFNANFYRTVPVNACHLQE